MKYKYLQYAPCPINLDPNSYDLVGDKEFCDVDSRIPLLIATQFGIFPSGGTYNRLDAKDYSILEGLGNQKIIAFVGRGYLTNRERKGIYHLKIEEDTIKMIKSKQIFIDLHLWYENLQNASVIPDLKKFH